jgi:hypothetical protein
MAKKVQKVDLYKENGEVIYLQREPGEMLELMERDGNVAYAVMTEGIQHEGINHYRSFRTIKIYTREEFEKEKENGIIKFTYNSKS